MIRTGIRCIDTLGGLREGSIIEFVGASRSGKTHLLHQILTYYLMDDKRAEAIFFNVDSTFNPVLIEKIIANIVRDNSSLDELLQRIKVVELPESSERVMHILDKLLRESRANNIHRIVVIDSITNLFVSSDSKEYTRSIVRLGMKLRQLVNNTQKFTILLANQIRDLISKSELTYDFFWVKEGIVPALGKIWEYFVDTRIYIKRQRAHMGIILVIFSDRLPETFCSFKYGDILY